MRKHSKDWSLLDLGNETSKAEEITTEDLTNLGQDIDISKKKTCNRESQGSIIPKHPFHSSQKRFRRGQINLRPFTIKQLYQTSPFQNANHQRGKADPTKGLLDNFNRPERRFLARRSFKKKTSIPRFPLQESGLAIQSHAIRSECGTKNIYKSRGSRSKINGERRDMVSALSRRSTHCHTHKRALPASSKSSNFNFKISRLDNQRQEVKATASSSLCLARSQIRPHLSHSNGSPRESGIVSREAKTFDNVKKLHCKRNHAVARIGELDRPVRSNNKIDNLKNKTNDMVPQKVPSGLSHYPGKRCKAQSLQMGLGRHRTSKSRITIPEHSGSDRRLSEGLGIPNKRQSFLGQIRPVNEVRHMHPRDAYHLVRTDHNFQETCSYSGTLRQYNCSASGHKRNLYKPIPITPDGANMEESSIASVDSICFSHKGVLQCSSGSTLENRDSSNRVVSPTNELQGNSEKESQPTSGPVRLQPQSSTEDIYLPMPRQEGCSSGRPINTLGPMGPPISLPTNESDSEGPTQANQLIFQDSCVSDTRYSHQTMVYVSTSPQGPFIPTEDETSADSIEQDSDHGPDYPTSRLAVIEATYNKRFPHCEEAINLMAKPLRDSSLTDYQIKWRKFMEFLIKERIPPKEVTLSSVIRFFYFLFNQRQLKPGTVSHYRSALTVPLLLHYKIDLKSPEISDLIRGMHLKRPSAPVTEPQWNLNKVLTFIDSWSDPIPDLRLLRKTAFLLLLATGWRISELHACVREEEYCHFTLNSTLRLRPHPSFLAKNERPYQRWDHKEIRSLTSSEGDNSKLCPVATLRNYLNSSNRINTGPLFRSPCRAAKPLTKHQLSTHICRLILEADPLTAAKVHDVRKYASSYALAKTMLVGDLM